MSRLACLIGFLLSVLPGQPVAAADVPPLIPRHVVMGLENSAPPQLSPDGRLLSFIKASDKGIPNVWVRTIGTTDDRMATSETKSGVYQYQWSGDGSFILYLKDSDGDENFHLYGLDLASGLTRDFTPFAGIKAQNLLISSRVPGQALIGLNIRDRKIFDMYRIDLRSGAVELDTTNPGDVRWWLPDAGFQIRAAVSISAEDSHQELRIRDGRDKPWRVLINWPFGESGVVEGYGSDLAIAFSLDGKALFVQSALHADTTQLLKVDLATGKEQLIAHNPKANIWNVMDQTLYDFAQVLFDPATGEPQAVAFNYLKPEWKVLDPALAGDFAFLQDEESVPLILGRGEGDRTWLVGKLYDNRPTRYYFYDRAARKLGQIFSDPPETGRYTFAKIECITIKARDGLMIPCYLTLPAGIPAKNLPMILLPHGGPWARDDWGWDSFGQMLANRGYAALRVNFRGSAGYGKSFMNAGNGQWGVGRMQHDLTDAVKWMVQKGYVDPKRVGILGGSYGGYAVLAGLAFTPDVYACGVDMSGIANLKTFFETMPDFWKPIKRRWVLRIGDAEHDEELNKKISPVHHADAIRSPLLIGHGVNDPRVKISESEQIAAAMRKRNIPVTLIAYPDEGHGFQRPQNILDFLGRAEEFLAKYLGGRFEPWTKIEGSSAEVR